MTSTKKSRIGKGLAVALLNSLIYIVAPIFLMVFDFSSYGATIVISKEFLMKWLVCGIAIVIVSFFTTYFEKGDIARFYVTIVQVVVVIVSIFVIFGVGTDNIISVEYKDYSFTLGLSLLAVLVFVAIARALKIPAAYFDYLDYREKPEEETEEETEEKPKEKTKEKSEEKTEEKPQEKTEQKTEEKPQEKSEEKSEDSVEYS